MSGSKFVYIIYIRTTPEKLWRALTEPEFTRQYWGGTHQESEWRVGSKWRLMIPDGRVGDRGEILEIDPPRKLVLSWAVEFIPDLKADGATRLTYEIEQLTNRVKLTLTHESDVRQSKVIDAVSNGWPELLSSLKSLLETGAAFPGDDQWPEGL